MGRRFLNAALLSGIIVLVAISPARAQPSSCVSPPSGLVAWWSGDVDAADIWGANPGTLMNGASIVPGVADNAFSFDGVDDFIELNNSPSMDFGTGDFTISVWIKLSSLTGIREILHKSVGDVLAHTNQTYFLEYLSSPQRLRFRVGDVGSNNFNDLQVQVSLAAGQWYHVAAVRRGVWNILYLDGTEITQLMAAQVFDTGIGGNARIGQLVFNGVSGQSRPFSGLIDEIQLFDRALCPAEIQRMTHAVRNALGLCKNGSTGGATCDDDCITGSVCDRGQCVGGDPVSCDDGNDCSDDACFGGLGCQHSNNTLPCDDGNACSTGEMCQGGVCKGILPVEVCNGLDDDCNGLVDDGIPPTTTTCGVGACLAAGTTSCVFGAVIDSCHAGTPAAGDATCDAVDDDCDGATDEEYVPVATSCGVGACLGTGTTSCVGGTVVDSCRSGTPAVGDATCNGVDDDCDGAADEDYVPVATACGIGACRSTGVTSCVAGTVVDGCHAAAPSPEVCNGIDDDCDSLVDNGADVISTCGVGRCGGAVLRRCLEGALEPDTCTPRPDGTLCDDAIACTTDDACSSGVCVGANRCVAQITPASSSCMEFVSGNAANLNSISYRMRGTTIQWMTPRAFNDFSTLVAPAADFTITIVQSHTNVLPDWQPVEVQGDSQIDLFEADCTRSRAQGSSQVDPATGTVTIAVTGAMPGQFYVVGIRYQADSLVSAVVLRPHPVVVYTFTTSGSGSDTVVFVPRN